MFSAHSGSRPRCAVGALGQAPPPRPRSRPASTVACRATHASTEHSPRVSPLRSRSFARSAAANASLCPGALKAPRAAAASSSSAGSPSAGCERFSSSAQQFLHHVRPRAHVPRSALSDAHPQSPRRPSARRPRAAAPARRGLPAAVSARPRSCSSAIAGRKRAARPAPSRAARSPTAGAPRASARRPASAQYVLGAPFPAGSVTYQVHRDALGRARRPSAGAAPRSR